MSMGNSACFSEVIEPKKIRRILGNLEDGRKLTSFIRLFNKLEEDEGASCLIEFLTDGNDNAVSDPDSKDLVKLRSLWEEITGKVKDKTGLDLNVDFHDSDGEGDNYDEVDGLYFEFFHSQLYQPTPELKSLQKLYGDDVVNRCFYTVFG